MPCCSSSETSAITSGLTKPVALAISTKASTGFSFNLANCFTVSSIATPANFKLFAAVTTIVISFAKKPPSFAIAAITFNAELVVTPTAFREFA